MSSVDDRIVNMQFNNKQFTQGAADSQKALEGLDKTLANAGKGGGLTSMGTAVDGVTNKFSALQVAGVAALATVVSKATTAGLSMLKSFSIDPIIDGFQEYQKTLTSVQTIMANAGLEGAKGVKTVNKYLDDLNQYSDQTIYNFGEMAKNIGTFTAAGVKLDTATSAIKGIANLAAFAGANSQQASSAMYQLSQAIAAGTVNLMDWRSVVNAGMGGKATQNALAQTAVAMGKIDASAIKVTDQVRVAGETFRESIGGGDSWLTADILVNTLAALDGRFAAASYEAQGLDKAEQELAITKARVNLETKEGIKYTEEEFAALRKMANAAYESATVVKTLPQLMDVTKESIGSIWANSFTLIMGNFMQSKKLWTSVSDSLTGTDGIITKMGSSWLGLLRDFVNPKKGKGRIRILDTLRIVFLKLGKIMGAFKDAWRDIFPAATGKSLANIVLGFQKFVRVIHISEDVISKLRTIFGGFFSLIHIGTSIIGGFASFFGNVFKAIFAGSKSSRTGILSIVASVAEVITHFDKWLTSGDRIGKVMGGLGTAVGSFIKPVLAGLGYIAEAFSNLFSGGGMSKLTSEFDGATGSIEGFGQVVSTVVDKIRSLFSSGSALSSGFADLRANIGETIDSAGGLENIFKDIGRSAGDAAAGGIDIAKDIARGLASGIADSAPIVWDGVKALAAGVIEAVKTTLGIHSPARTMVPLGESVSMGLVEGIRAGIVWIATAVGEMGAAIIGGIRDAFMGMDALDLVALMNALFSAQLLVTLNNFSKGFAGIGDSVIGTMSAMQSSLKADALLAIAAAIALLVASLVALSLIDPVALGYGIGAIASLMTILVAAMKVMGTMDKTVTIAGKSIPVFNANLVTMSASLLLLAGAMVVLSVAVAILGSMDLETLGKGLGAMAIGLGILVKALTYLDDKIDRESITGLAASILIMAVAMQAMAVAIAMMGYMDPVALGQGLGGMAIGLAILTTAMVQMDKRIGKDIGGLAASILILATAMVVLAGAVAAFGRMDPATLEQGLTGMAWAIGLVTIALMTLATNAVGVIAAAKSMALMSAAVVGFAIAVGILGNMNGETLAQGLMAVALGFVILIAAAAGAMVVAAGLEVLGTTVLLLGAGLALAGIGMLAFAAGLALLASVGVAAALVMGVAIMTFLALLPNIAVQVVAAFVAFVEAIAAATPRVQVAMLTILKSMLQTIIEAIPEFQRVTAALLQAAYITLMDAVPKWIHLGITIISAFIQAVNNEIPRIAESAMEMIAGFLAAVAKDIDDVIEAGTAIIVKFLNGMGKANDEILSACGQLIVDILDGIAQAIDDYSEPIRDAGLRIAWELINGMTGGIAENLFGAVKGAIGRIDFGSIDLLGLPGPLRSMTGMEDGRQIDKGRNRKSIYQRAKNAVNAAYKLINKNANSPADPKLIRKAQAAQKRADRQAAEAQMADERAKKLEKIANKKKATKAQKEAARKARNEAKIEGRQAQVAQNRANSAERNMQADAEFKRADYMGKGDIMNDRADTMADRAQKLLQLANAEAAKAKELMKTNKKAGQAMMNQAKQDAAEARKLAQAARDAADKAQGFYTKEVRERLKLLGKEKAQRERDEKFESADKETKLKMLAEDAAAAQRRADKAQKEAEKLIKLAKRKAANDPTRAMELLDAAEEQAAKAEAAAQEAEQARQAAEQLRGQSGTGASGTGGNIGPSRSVLEDAARSIDRYTETLAEATELAAATQTVTQYNQTINSPTALDAATVYRHSRNLVSASDINAGADPLIPLPG